VKQPLEKLGASEKYDIKVNLCGGGFTGQSQALRLAIARALVKINPEDKAVLRAEGFMTRDPRAVERKKPGQPKARRRFQFSKR
jgi:small subunit ribosomal protein S9